MECNNHFGIKCFAKSHKGCCVKFFDDGNDDSFRKFSNPKQSFAAHSEVLKKARYKPCFAQGKNWWRWAEQLKKSGYATDKDYPKKIRAAVIKYQLWQYDGDGQLNEAQAKK
jgi:flagellum-specific peptidoglycan hydrolase FlgJ